MSFGFARVYQTISDKIDDVVRERQQHILLFAAAGNGGKNSEVEFPASHRNVFSVHSTDHLGNYSTFDTGLKNEIATLGEGIGGLVTDGTSNATPIAAATCALVLDAARDCASSDGDLVNTDALGRYRPLCTLRGMEKAISLREFTPKSHTGSRCLDPREFCNSEKVKRHEVLDYATL